MLPTTTRPIQESESVKSAGSRPPYSASFLRIQKDDARIRVIPTALGKRKLPRFWTVWLEDLILKQTRPEQQFHVSIDKHHVLIGADGKITANGLWATVVQLTAQVYAPKHLPLVPKRSDERNGMARIYCWTLEDDTGEALGVPLLQSLLPKGSRLTLRLRDEFDIQLRDELRLSYSGNLPEPQHVKLQVEYFAFKAMLLRESSTNKTGSGENTQSLVGIKDASGSDIGEPDDTHH